jgi:hypothetical protein
MSSSTPTSHEEEGVPRVLDRVHVPLEKVAGAVHKDVVQLRSHTRAKAEVGSAVLSRRSKIGQVNSNPVRCNTQRLADAQICNSLSLHTAACLLAKQN